MSEKSVEIKKEAEEIVCLQAEGWTQYGEENWESYLICDECGSPIHYWEQEGLRTHEVSCPFCGGFIGVDD